MTDLEFKKYRSAFMETLDKAAAILDEAKTDLFLAYALRDMLNGVYEHDPDCDRLHVSVQSVCERVLSAYVLRIQQIDAIFDFLHQHQMKFYKDLERSEQDQIPKAEKTPKKEI